MSSFGRWPIWSSGWSRLVSVAHLSMAPSITVMSWVGAAPVAQFLRGPSCGQGGCGACRSKGTLVGEHVPDRLAEAAADLDRGDFRAALFAVAVAHPLHDRAVARVTGGGVRGLDQRPAQVLGAVLAQRAAPVAFAGLLDPGRQTGVADQLA